MREFTDYAEAAIKRFGLSGYNNLARELGITKSTMSHFRSGKITPSEETFLKIVELAGMPKEEALIDLNLWRSKNKPELLKVWQRLSKMIGCCFAVLAMPFNAYASTLIGRDNSLILADFIWIPLLIAAFYAKYKLCDKLY